jgi:hypothetical protein
MASMKSKTITLLFIIGLFACAATRKGDLSDRVETFNESLRWSSLKAASSFMDEHNKRTLIEKYSKDFQKSHIVDYSIVDIGMDPSQKTGTVLVEFSFYDNLTQNLDYRQELQTWEYNGVAKNWVMKDARDIPNTQQ